MEEDGWVDGRMNACDRKQMDSWLEGHRWDGGKCMKMNGWMTMLVDGWMNGWMGIYADAEMCKRMEG